MHFQIRHLLCDSGQGPKNVLKFHLSKGAEFEEIEEMCHTFLYSNKQTFTSLTSTTNYHFITFDAILDFFTLKKGNALH